MHSHEAATPSGQFRTSNIERFIDYPRHSRKNDGPADRKCGSTREDAFKIPVLTRITDTLVGVYLRLKAARKLDSQPRGDVNTIAITLCDEWIDAQVKAFRLTVNRSVTWAGWIEEPRP